MIIKNDQIKRAKVAMRKDKVHEFRGLTSADAPDAVTAIVLLSRRIGELEIQVGRINAKLFGEFKVKENQKRVSKCCRSIFKVCPENKKINRGCTYWYECDLCHRACDVISG